MRKPVELARLKKIPLFEGVADAKLLELADLFQCKEVASKTAILTHEQPGETVYIILGGSVRIVVEGNDKDIVLAVCGPGEVIGEMGILEGVVRSATVITQEKSTLLWMTRATFLEQLWKLDPVPFNMACILSQRLRSTSMQLHTLITLNVNGRVASQLLTFAKERGKPIENGGILIPFRLTQADLADMVGASRVRVNQILVDWKQRQYITVDINHHITVLDRKALKRFIQ